MKTLQKHFTTPEQSKMLLELGLPADSADCYFDDISGQVKVKPSCFFYPDNPCWSVGRLIEIMLLCHISDNTGIMFDKPLYEVSNCTNIEWCIRVLESSIKCSHIDFSKLEE